MSSYLFRQSCPIIEGPQSSINSLNIPLRGPLRMCMMLLLFSEWRRSHVAINRNSLSEEVSLIINSVSSVSLLLKNITTSLLSNSKIKKLSWRENVVCRTINFTFHSHQRWNSCQNKINGFTKSGQGQGKLVSQ